MSISGVRCCAERGRMGTGLLYAKLLLLVLATGTGVEGATGVATRGAGVGTVNVGAGIVVGAGASVGARDSDGGRVSSSTLWIF